MSQGLSYTANRALELALLPADSGNGSELETTLRDLCDEARRTGTRPETLIVLFKKSWAERPELRTMSRESASARFEQVISMCIHEYYERR
jgi:hypothetical protein